MGQTSNIQLPQWSEALLEPKRFKVLHGGRGSSKSWTVARLLLLMASQRRLQILCVRETQESIGASVHRLLKNQIDAMGLPGWTIQNDRIFATNGSEFTFAGIRTDPDKVKSSESVHICWVEEAERVSAASWKVLTPTIRAPGSEIWITFNPREATDPTYQRFVANPPPDALVLQVNWRDNPWFPDELRAEKDHMARVDPDEHAHVWEGKCKSRTDSQVLKGKWRVEPFEPKETWDGPYFGLDFGFSADPNHGVECYVGDGNVWIRRESRSVHLDTDHLPGRLTEDMPGIVERECRCDNARPETISYLQRHGLPKAIAAHKWPHSVEDGIKWLRSHDAIVIHPDCPHLAEEARLWSYKVDRLTDEVLAQLVDANNHGWDAVRYALDPAIRGKVYSGREPKFDFAATPNVTPWGIR